MLKDHFPGCVPLQAYSTDLPLVADIVLMSQKDISFQRCKFTIAQPVCVEVSAQHLLSTFFYPQGASHYRRHGRLRIIATAQVAFCWKSCWKNICHIFPSAHNKLAASFNAKPLMTTGTDLK